jgi:hypothetical protein
MDKDFLKDDVASTRPRGRQMFCCSSKGDEVHSTRCKMLRWLEWGQGLSLDQEGSHHRGPWRGSLKVWDLPRAMGIKQKRDRLYPGKITLAAEWSMGGRGEWWKQGPE